MVNVKHQCCFCDRKIFSAKLGAHIFRHDEELKKRLRATAKLGTNIIVPIRVSNIQICMVTRKAWDTPLIVNPKSPSIKHIAKPEYSKEKQIAALYEYLELDVPEAPRLVTSRADNDSYFTRQIASLDKQLADCRLEIAKLKVANNNVTTADYTTLKRDFENTIDLLKTKHCQDMERLQESNAILHQRLNELSPQAALYANKAINDITDDRFAVHKIMDLKKRLEKSTLQVSEPIPTPTPQPALKPKAQTFTCNTKGCCDGTSIVKSDYFTCKSCSNIACVNNDLTGCYKYECETCNVGICLTCVKTYGNRLRPRCKTHDIKAPEPEPEEEEEVCKSESESEPESHYDDDEEEEEEEEEEEDVKVIPTMKISITGKSKVSRVR
jgi:hypothetical protein